MTVAAAVEHPAAAVAGGGVEDERPPGQPGLPGRAAEIGARRRLRVVIEGDGPADGAAPGPNRPQPPEPAAQRQD
ncbi:hypothetical protein PUR71_36605 [Streptomyces sp. SP17BM10]|uniref:hypothetical protein n=1 Tax=Streptomyces sp. SP17BM10 TaxID=3002530 RepID=UPI002E79FB35|nr:hypothetical protein [Streptomyces sp. SP17BM10]MEE1788381.1 hypothetical protein [Streptomyces sp. SP17BM10]